MDGLESNKGFETCEHPTVFNRFWAETHKSSIASSARLAKYDLMAKMPLIVDNAFTNRASVRLSLCFISTMTTTP